MVSGSIALADQDREAASESLCEADAHEAESADRTKRGKCIDTYEASDDHGVHHRIYLLEQIAKEQWQREGQKKPQRAS